MSSEEEVEEVEKLPFSELVGVWKERIGTKDRMNLHSKSVSLHILFTSFIHTFYC